MRKYGMTLLASLAAAATLILAPAGATATTLMHQDFETQTVGANPGTGGSGGGGISLGVPTVTDAEANTGNQSVSMTYNTGDASSTQATAEIWSAGQSIPLDMKSVEIAVKMPAGNKFRFALEETGAWVYRFGPAQVQTVDNDWEVHRINLGAMNLDPQRLANDGNDVGNMRFRLLGAAEGGVQGQTGTLYVDTIQFTDQYGPFTAVTAIGYDNTTGPDWRDSSVAKPYDLDGDDVIGSDGFIVFEWNRRNVDGADPDRNAANDLISLPSYIDEIEVGAGFNRASTDAWNGWTLNCPVSNANRVGGNILGAAWNWDNKDTVVVKRNGVTDSFTMTVFINHHVVTQQTYVYLGTPQPQNLPSGYARIDNNQDGEKVHYKTFGIPAGDEDIVIQVYSQRSAIQGIAFDNLDPQDPIYPETTIFENFDDRVSGTVLGGNPYGDGGVAVGNPTITDNQAYDGSNSISVTFDTGDASAEWGSVEIWTPHKTIPHNMQSVRFASRMPAGTVFAISIQDNDPDGPTNPPYYNIHTSGTFLQTADNDWQINEVDLADLTEPIDPEELAFRISTTRVYFYGDEDGGISGQQGVAFLDTITFAEDAADTRYVLLYRAGENGSVQGTAVQSVLAGGDGTAVTAQPDGGYVFVEWSDGITDITRTDTAVDEAIDVTAIFAEEDPSSVLDWQMMK